MEFDDLLRWDWNEGGFLFAPVIYVPTFDGVLTGL